MYQQLKRASMALTLSSVCFLAFAQKKQSKVPLRMLMATQ